MIEILFKTFLTHFLLQWYKVKQTIRKPYPDYLHTFRDTYLQSFYLGRYIVWYGVGNLILLWNVVSDYIWWYTSSNENFQYGYPHSKCTSALTYGKKIFVRRKSECCKPVEVTMPYMSTNKNVKKLMKSNYFWQYVLGYSPIYCCKFRIFSNQTSHYICKCIRILTEVPS